MTDRLKKEILKYKQESSPLNGWYIINAVFAEMLLNLNTKNYRTMKMNRVKKYAAEMRAGKWAKNGQPIVVGRDGYLQDGQHRLMAIVEADVSLEMYIVFDAEITDIYDFVNPRTLNDMFRAEGKPVNSFEVAAGRAIIRYGTGKDESGNVFVHDFVEEKIELISKARSIVSAHGRVGKKAACAALVYCLLANKEVSESDMRNFFSIVNSGITNGSAKEPSPALVLRKQLENIKGGGQAQQKYVLEITYKALKDYKFENQRKQCYKDDTNDAERLVQKVYNNDKVAYAA